MDVRQLEYVVAVADHGGFTRAARAVHVSQPSLSHGVRTLEGQLGVELFARLGRSVRPTPAGELVIDAARQVLRDVAEVRTVAAAVAGLQQGRLEIVALPTLAVDPLAPLIGRFRRAHPGVTLRVREPEEGSAIDRQVTSGRAELGITDITSVGTGLTRVELFRQHVVAVCPPGTEVDGDVLSPVALAAMPLVATPVGTSTRRLLERAVARAGAEPTIAVEINTREAMLPLVLAGAGTALLPASLAAEAAGRGAVVRPLRPALTRRIGVVHRPGRLSPAAAAMMALARADASERALTPRG
jgi:LysR family transcriptional regulator, carnitine catabolism transcriptional activator